MRRARAADYWKRLYERKSTLSLAKVSFDGAACLGTGSLQISGALTVIVGGNGVGKSTLLDIAEMALGSCVVPEYRIDRHRSARVSAELDYRGNPYVIDLTVGSPYSGESLPFHVTRIDPGVEATQIRQWSGEVEELEELLESHAARILTSEEVQELCELVGKRYSKCLIYEIDDISDENPFPYFKVTADGIEYGFEAMGAGEASLFYLWWRLSQLDASCMVLLEEPETHVTSRSQRALMDLVAMTCESLKVSCIVTTHSPDIVSKVPSEHLRLIVREGSQIRIVSMPDKADLMNCLGLSVARQLTIYVEDRAAREFLKAIIRAIRPQLNSRIGILDVGGSSPLKTLLEIHPRVTEPPGIVGVFDGDQNSSQMTSSSTKHPVEQLPGKVAPEILLSTFVQSRLTEFSKLMAVDGTAVSVALNSLEGIDHHDWLEELSRTLHVAYDHLVAGLTVLWLTDAQNEADARILVERIDNYTRASFSGRKSM